MPYCLKSLSICGPTICIVVVMTCLSASLPNVAFLLMTASSIEKCAPTETAPNYKMIWTLWNVGRKPGECASILQSVTSFTFQGKKNQYCRSTTSRAQIWMRWILPHILGFTLQATWPGTSKWTKWLQKGIEHSDSPNETSEQPLNPPKNWHIVPLWDQSWSM